MANRKHLSLIQEDVDVWNKWRAENPDARPDLSGADFSQADLMMANLAGADLQGVSFVMAKLQGADLSGADLRKANLVGSRLIGVDFADADLRGADLSTAEDLTQEQLEQIRGDGQTKLPDGVQTPKNWK